LRLLDRAAIQNYVAPERYVGGMLDRSADRRLIYGGGVVYGARDPANIERMILPKLEKTFP